MKIAPSNSNKHQIKYKNLSEVSQSQALIILDKIRSEDHEHMFAPHDFSREFLEKIREANQDYYALIYLEEEVVGYCLMRGLDEGYPDFSIGIFIFSKFRKLGLAKSAILHLEKHALSKNVTQLRLSVKRNNVAAKKLYTKLGFNKVDFSDDRIEIWRKCLTAQEIEH